MKDRSSFTPGPAAIRIATAASFGSSLEMAGVLATVWSPRALPEHGRAGANHGAEEPARRSGPVDALRAPVPIGLEVDFDLDEERDLDRDLQAEFTLAEEVTDDLVKCAKPAAGVAQEFSELLHDVSPVIAFHRGDEIADREGVLHRGTPLL